jgi:potassium-transporting ATPase potassium-binding subunit
MVDQSVDTQTIVQGPMASQIAIKMLGTNGGGYVNANAAHPFENPTPLSNFIQMLSIFAIPSALTYYLGPHGEEPAPRLGRLGRDVRDVPRRRPRLLEGRGRGNPIHQKLGVAAADGNMEGKEVRFGIFNRRSSPRSRPTRRAARSTRCTTPSRRSAAWCRSSTSRPAR